MKPLAPRRQCPSIISVAHGQQVFVKRRAEARRRCCSTTFARFTTKSRVQKTCLRASQPPQSQSQQRLPAQLTRSGNTVFKVFSAAPHGSRLGSSASARSGTTRGKLMPSPLCGLGFTARAGHNVRRILQPALTPLRHLHAA
jgi:hypothetical protein